MKTTSLVLAAAAVGLSDAFAPAGAFPGSIGQGQGFRAAAQIGLRSAERSGLVGASMMARPPFIAGNWKMNPTTIDEAIALAKQVVEDAKSAKTQVAIFVPHSYISVVADIARGTNVEVGAQNCFTQSSGAFTGAVSTGMLKSVGAQHVLIGHSERRAIFGATEEHINEQMHKALSEGIQPLLCIGETKDEYEAGINTKICAVQIAKALKGISKDQMKHVTIAYEPVWAIGTGLVCDAKIAQKVHSEVRAFIEEIYDSEVAKNIRIQYGGSVTPESVDELMSMPDIDGCLVGGASLLADKWARIMNYEEVKGAGVTPFGGKAGGLRDRIFNKK